MAASPSPSSSYSPYHTFHSTSTHRHCFTSPIPTVSQRRLRASARLLVLPPDSASETDSASSWSPITLDPSLDADEFGGWSFAYTDSPRRTASAHMFPAAAVAVGGASVTALLASISCFYFSRKGLGFQFPAPPHHLSDMIRKTEAKNGVAKEADDVEMKVNTISTNIIEDQVEEKPIFGERKLKMIPIVADSTQLEALHILRKLNIIETDVQPSEICTRREYARWLIKANILLERNAKHKIAPSMLIAGSTVTAFSDINTGDPDFFYIQAIGEAGILRSKLSDCIDNGGASFEQKYEFAPERFLSRIDLISWKAQLEFPLNLGLKEEMLRLNADFFDLGSVTPDALQWLFMDALAGEKSIARRVFGNIRRLQPSKPVSKAQVAIALTSGRMAEAIRIEVARIETENMARLINRNEIMSELIQNGEIPRYWEEKQLEERNLASKYQQEFSEVLDQLEKENLTRRMEIEGHIKEKAALDCQKVLLSNLKIEVDAMFQKLAHEKAIVSSEQQTLDALVLDVRQKQDATFESKSILEAEIEALRIMKSWVEDGARQNQFRRKVLENAVQRWKWDDQSGLSESS